MMFRRRREKKTNYRRRLGLVKSGRTRLVIRKSLKNMVIQFIDYNEKGDQTLLTVNSKLLKKKGWKYSTGNVPSSYLLGLLAGTMAKKKNITDAILDIGLQRSTKGSRIYAALKGVIDAGVNVPADESIFPSEERIKGKHISDYTSKASGNQFSKLKPTDIEANFNETKERILNEV
ncbi:MAG: 50S ribosomal protein L18 [Candidatus Aenigmarchaeota archaeon]|nr:50S ribosomal protein L18 [Candidatus Aenigmarchaeota archaeon]